MGLAEVLAAKKAAAEKQAGIAPTESKPANAVSVSASNALPVAEAEQQAQAAPAAEVVTVSKPLSFAEKMALKKQQEAAAQIQRVEPAPGPSPLQTMAAAQKEAATLQAAAPAEEMSETDVQIRQAYGEIAQKIDELAAYSTEDLAPAMSNLKKALMANPAACELMLDEDIGKMVIALRRVTNTVIADAKAGKEPKAKKQKIADMSAFSAEEIMDAWNEI